MKSQIAIVKRESIDSVIFFIRGQRVIVDQDLALLYGVPTKSLNLAVKRNQKRFPPEFMFQLTHEEFEALRFQFDAIRELMDPPVPKRKPIGFRIGKTK